VSVSACDALRERVAAELGRPAPPAARALADAIAARHGDAVDAVVFYGSCLRKSTHEGVLDFYVLVDDLGRVYRDEPPLRRAWWTLTNHLLPPNVFYLEAESTLEPGAAPTRVRCKYALMSSADFERMVGPRALHPYVWARFAQPALTVRARDDAARRHVAHCAALAAQTLVRRIAPLLPVQGGPFGSVQRFSLAALWQEAFRRTYRTELRGESTTTIRSHYLADPARYDEVGRLALAVLREEGWIEEFVSFGAAAEVTQRPGRRIAGRLRWGLAWPVAKTLAVLRLLKTATTFGDWLPYVLWKIERHSGVQPELSERQRRHPLIFGWPVIWRLLRGRTLR